MPEAILAVVVVAVVAAAVALAAAVIRRSGTVRAPLERPHRGIITLDIGTAQAGHPGVERLARDAARHSLAMDPALTEVEVRSQSGGVLGMFPRSAAAPVRQIAMPAAGVAHRHVVIHLPGDPDEDRPVVAPPRFAAPQPAPPKRPLAEILELPEIVRHRLRRPDDAIDIVRAVLETAGHKVSVEGDLIVAGDLAIVVIQGPATHKMLNHAYLRFRAGGTKEGVVIATGILPSGEASRREMLAPELRHTGVEAIQRMADAAAIGADPLRFIVPVRAIAG